MSACKTEEKMKKGSEHIYGKKDNNNNKKSSIRSSYKEKEAR